MAPAPPGLPGHADGNVIVKPYFPNSASERRFLLGLEEAKQWEIRCPDCDDGSRDEAALPPDVQALRGPYSSKERAWEVAERHMGMT
jgi:hypothetical protein